MGRVGQHHVTLPVGSPRSAASRAVVAALARVAPPARDRDAGAEAAAIVRWARVAGPAGTLTAELDTPEAASRLVSLLTRIGATDGVVQGDADRDAWRVEMPDADDPAAGHDPLAARLGLVDGRGRALAAPPAWLTGGSLPGAVATWRGALLARGNLAPEGAGIVVDCPAPGPAVTLAELGLRLGVRAGTRRDGAGARVLVTDPDEVTLLLTTCGGRAAAAAARVDEPAGEPTTGTANDARATVAASRAGAAVAEAFTALERAGVAVPDSLAEAGRLRLAHPDLGLADLAARADPPLSKDALAGRLRRLLTLADRHR
ncbi:DNA-binding protein WhiA [Actinomycetospora endophytica]|uniref:DNA-binding protein WhiA n=1 Tax=Actinomycetospora endophytica TaxID=2291215 RepID=A0ABS8P6C5_9PSEU|nr:DNA-binding protein WhiA [Actinomycetospora endophytica]MCD2193808.1 DNA-binding protein WhiA [Actinomycetospora endophytica]